MSKSPEGLLKISESRLKKVSDESDECMTEEIQEMVHDISDKQLKEAQGFIEEDVKRNWEWYLDKKPNTRKLDPENQKDRQYRIYFNNFKTRLPGYYSNERIFQRYKSDDWNSPKKKWLDDSYEKYVTSKEEKEIYSGYSELRLRQTGKEFTGTIYACIEASGLSTESIVGWQDEMKYGKQHGWSDFFQFVMPVYMRLVALGYNRKDLTA